MTAADKFDSALHANISVVLALQKMMEGAAFVRGNTASKTICTLDSTPLNFAYIASIDPYPLEIGDL